MYRKQDMEWEGKGSLEGVRRRMLGRAGHGRAGEGRAGEDRVRKVVGRI